MGARARLRFGRSSVDPAPMLAAKPSPPDPPDRGRGIGVAANIGAGKTAACPSEGLEPWRTPAIGFRLRPVELATRRRQNNAIKHAATNTAVTALMAAQKSSRDIGETLRWPICPSRSRAFARAWLQPAKMSSIQPHRMEAAKPSAAPHRNRFSPQCKHPMNRRTHLSSAEANHGSAHPLGGVLVAAMMWPAVVVTIPAPNLPVCSPEAYCVPEGRADDILQHQVKVGQRHPSEV